MRRSLHGAVCEQEHAAADKGCLDLCAWLAEEVKGGKLEPEKVFAALHTFALALEKAHAFNVEAVEKEAKRKRMEAAAKAREEEMAARKLSKASSGGSAAGKGGGPAGPAGLGSKGGARPGGPRPPGNGPPRPGFGMAGVNDELTRKLAARGNGRGNLVDAASRTASPTALSSCRSGCVLRPPRLDEALRRPGRIARLGRRRPLQAAAAARPAAAPVSAAVSVTRSASDAAA